MRRAVIAGVRHALPCHGKAYGTSLMVNVAKAQVRPAGSLQPWADSLALTIAIGVAYFLAARLSLELLTKPAGLAVFWPAAGIAAGVLIALGPKAWLPVIAGTMGATILANILGDRNIWSTIVFA